MSRNRILTTLLVLQTGLCVPALAADPILPDHTLTPGAVLTVDASCVCQRDYSKSVRHTSLNLKKEIYREYGIPYQAGRYEVDHLIPLGIGGADVKENLWPQSHFTNEWNADRKDRLEWKLHVLICGRKVDIREAQTAIASNWIDAYQKFCPTEQSCPPYQTRFRETRSRRKFAQN